MSKENDYQGEPVAFLCTKEGRSDWRHIMPVDYEYLDSWRANPKISVTPLYAHADPAEVERLRKLSVTNIMLDVVPGEDGMGHEVYAKSVADVENALSSTGERLGHLAIWHAGFRELLRKIRPYVLSQEGITAEIDDALSASVELEVKS